MISIRVCYGAKAYWQPCQPSKMELFAKIANGFQTLAILAKSSILEFFLSKFSFTDTEDSQDSKGREEAIFITLYHFYPLRNIQTLTCNFACGMTTTYFNRMQLPDWYSMRFITLLIDDGLLISVCLPDDSILAFITIVWRRQGKYWNSLRLSSL